jgi:hypothetical protein
MTQIIDLATELAKPEYLAMNNNQAHAAIQVLTIAEGSLIPATTVNQLFASLSLSGAIDDIAVTKDHPFRDKMSSLNKSIIGNHPFNFIAGTTSGNGNLAMLDSMIAGMPELSAKLTQFKNTVFPMANFKRKFPSVTIDDVIKARAAQLDGQWHEIESTDKQWLQVQLNTRTPENTHIVVQWQAVDGEWYHAQALHGLLAPMQYRAQLPYHGVPRKLRWRCDYALDGQVMVA